MLGDNKVSSLKIQQAVISIFFYIISEARLHTWLHDFKIPRANRRWFPQGTPVPSPSPFKVRNYLKMEEISRHDNQPTKP